VHFLLRILLVAAVAVVLALTLPQRSAYQEQLAGDGFGLWPTE
jgi:hypothetical protein